MKQQSPSTSFPHFICKLTQKSALPTTTLHEALAQRTLLSRTKENLRKYQSALETCQDSGSLCCLLWGQKATPSQHVKSGVWDFRAALGLPSLPPCHGVPAPQPCWGQPHAPYSPAFVCPLGLFRTGSSDWVMGAFKHKLEIAPDSRGLDRLAASPKPASSV